MRMGVNFSLAGGAKGASSRRTAKVKLVRFFRTVDMALPCNQLIAKLFHPHPGLKSCVVVAYSK